ncbi:polysaccharide deacetylase family protein [Candidatus Thiothrix sp. Deng01]|uniref:Polysaccharide deacetylase family protein n=1 Tax=Candidatus Thiothrix phosphatis TaxID=3112415 RepID=A0ABU6CTL0_9GAMM|nr:polysaccharide deacetylase family protein [Candidatus Thiothrix sp. Deng01]MEB4590143.1 polysaccharide deacetylase family protein [Candidatus Thiothrix sp. Deng01]
MIFSADIEDWQQSVYDFDRAVSNRVVRNTSRLLDILDEHDVIGTFFIQGMVAEKFPNLVRSIADAGHELACHSHSHRMLYNLTEAQFRTELRRSMAALEDISGSKVIGFRAPTFSVRDDILDWYCAALREEGVVYDSSIMIATVRSCYGFTDDGILRRIAERGLDSYPMSVSRVLGKNIPVLGGGYFRIYPYWLTQWLARKLDQNTSIFYMHPYELDTNEYREVSQLVDIPTKMAVHQFARRGSVEGKLRKLLLDYPFSSFRDTYYPA